MPRYRGDGGGAVVEKVGTLKIEYWWLEWYNSSITRDWGGNYNGET